MHSLRVLLFLMALATPAFAADCDPLAVASTPVKTLDLTVHDSTRDRDIPIRVYLPATKCPG